MKLELKNPSHFKNRLIRNGFNKKTGVLGVPTVTYTKDDIEITFLHNFIHTSEKGLIWIIKNYKE